MALAPIVVILIGVLAFGVIGGIIWLLPTPSSPDLHVHHSPIPEIVALSLLGSGFVAMISISLYPWFYSHCRGSEYLAQFEALNRERKDVTTEFYKKIEDVNRRQAELVASGRTQPLPSGQE